MPKASDILPQTNVVPLRAKKRLDFEAVQFPFPVANDEWCDVHLPWTRMAIVTVGKSRSELDRVMKNLLEEEGSVPDILENWSIQKQYFGEMVKMLDSALLRAFVVLEDMGYGPDNPPR